MFLRPWSSSFQYWHRVWKHDQKSIICNVFKQRLGKAGHGSDMLASFRTCDLSDSLGSHSWNSSPANLPTVHLRTPYTTTDLQGTGKSYSTTTSFDNWGMWRWYKFFNRPTTAPAIVNPLVVVTKWEIENLIQRCPLNKIVAHSRIYHTHHR